MPNSEDLPALRLAINEPEDIAPYDDARLIERLNVATSVTVLAGEIWSEKAAKYADLVDVQEGSSKRNLGDLYEQAIAMARHYGSVDAEPEGPTLRRSRTRPIVRP